MPDLLTAVKILGGSPVEIAAASVGETSLVKAVRKMEEDGKSLDLTLEVVEPEVLEATPEVLAKEEAEEGTLVTEEELQSAEADAESPAAEELVKEETPAPVAAAAEEEEAISLSEEPATSTLTVEEVGEVESEDQAAVPAAAPEEAVSSTDTSPEDAAPAEEATPAEEAITAAEAAPVDETTSAAETWVEDAAAEASTEEAVEALATTHSEAAAVVDTTQLAAASSGSDLEVLSAASEAPVHEAKHCHSCHSATSAAEEVAPPAALGVQLTSEEVVDITLEVREAVSLAEGQTTETMEVATTQS
ncbi:uncharacterized protein LOC116394250 isoform X2 [Anarrhichthys ocellatus]|uniref:uncharacterized protein LOC116394250 isoform X2 n=1 Tax=Anarrhichthys ocellatus TaxID=433405 RepID=UPI0012ED4B62|nr:uncharacterized protein LOC116394250 isoform X2 [Anarrhichthys ocellatus]